jgi:hypothetical protein
LMRFERKNTGDSSFVFPVFVSSSPINEKYIFLLHYLHILVIMLFCEILTKAEVVVVDPGPLSSYFSKKANNRIGAMATIWIVRPQ